MNRIYCYLLVACTPVLAQVSPQINGSPSREFGQPQLLPTLNSVAPNLVEGRELSGPNGVAFDTSVSPPILYVADTFNHRVLAFQNPDSYTKCGTSDATCGFASSKVIGQRDRTATLPRGPGTELSAGLTFPTSVAVDSSGNLYVADGGNNRILRFPAPFKQTGSLLSTDLVIGQPGVTSGIQTNQGLSKPTAQTLALSSGGSPFRTSMAFEPGSGNLWVSDPGNNRVLRFPGQQLTAGTVQPAADLVLGQFDLVSNQILPTPQGTSAQLYKNSLAQPSGLVFDQNGGLYVSDGFSRVLYYVGPFVNGLAARRILGVNPPAPSGQQQTPYPNQFTLGLPGANGSLIPPEGVFTNGTNVLVADAGANRIVVYDAPANWPAEITSQPSPPILASVPVIGQNDKVSGKANKGQPQPDATTLRGPTAAAFLGTELWVADSGNNRVLAFSPQGPLSYQTASRVLGQLDYLYNTPNLIEGKEVFFFSSGIGSAGIVIDSNSSPPHLYVADSLNNRVLGFADARKVQPGSRADLVLGQPDLFRSVANYPSGDLTQPNSSSLLGPTGVAVDGNGDLYVTDTGNGRVLRFPAPFAQPSSVLQPANLVLGQFSFTQQIRDPSPQTMRSPFGVALFAEGSLAVSDATHNRVLIFKRPPGGDFTNGQAAVVVLGQADFISTASAPATSLSGMNSPRHVATDTSDRLYVCDSNNSRVMIYTNTRNASNGAASVFQINSLSAPQGVFVSGNNSGNTGEIWVANTNSNVVYRYPEFQTLLTGAAQVAQISLQTPPLALTLDSAGNLLVAEGANRVTFYFALLTYRNAANSNQAGLAPGMLAYIGQVGRDFGLPTGLAQSLPWPATMSGVQVLVGDNETPAPLYAVNNGAPYIWFQMPMSAPTSGTVTLKVVRPATGEILSAASLPAVPANPGFFTTNSQGTGQVVATNFDQVGCSPFPACATNSQANQVARGSTIIFCLTGQGFVSGGAPDGAAPVFVPTPTLPVVLSSLGGGTLDPSNVASGLGCGYPGLWQINLKIPQTHLPGQTSIVITLNDVPSNNGPTGRLTTTFWVK